MKLLEVKGISKSYKALQVLKDVSLDLYEQERHVIIGPNGAGKTTLFNCIFGTIPMDKGQVLLSGVDVTAMPSHKRVSLGMSRTFQKNNLFEQLTIEENLHLAFSSLKPYRRRLFRPLASYRDLAEDTEKLLKEWKLWDRRDRLVHELSYGEQRILEIMLAFASNPKVLMLDEPTSGMSVAETALTTQIIQNLPRTTSLLVIEHDMEVVFAIADRITVIHHGEVLITGSPEEIRSNEMVREIYFGGGALKDA